MESVVSKSRARSARALGAVALVVLTALIAVPGSAVAAVRTKLVRYHGMQVRVPISWPVFQLRSHSHVCVRFNRHAIYLGRPGTDQACPAQAAGRTEAILLAPEAHAAQRARMPHNRLVALNTAGAASGSGSFVRLVDRADHVVVAATWRHQPAVVARALGLRSVNALRRAARHVRPAPALSPMRAPSLHALAVSATDPATPGQLYQGLGFDTCNAPPESSMAAWGTYSTYGAVGIYIGGADLGCPVQTNLTAAWVAAESTAGWHLIPIYVGLQSPTNDCPVPQGTKPPGCAPIVPAQAAAEGTAAAQDAVAHAQALGIGTGNPIYFDMEGYNNTSGPAAAIANTAVLTFLQAWTVQLHASGYLSGVYSSAASGVSELASQVGTPYVEPDDIWIADWMGSSQAAATDAGQYVPSADWSANQRLYQYAGANTESFGGVEIDVDNDYVDGATAAFGSAAVTSAPPPPPPPPPPPAPSLRITASGDGSLKLSPSWAREPGLSGFQILAGSSPTAMAPIASVPVTHAAPIVIKDIHPYFEVTGVNAAGQALGTSAAVKAPARVAVFATTAFVSPRGRLGVPVECMDASPCKVTAGVYRGRRRLTSTTPEPVSRHGGIVHLALGANVARQLLRLRAHRLPARLSVINGAGVKTKTDITLVPYRTSGAAPRTTLRPGSTLRILAATALVSNGWVGEIPVACASSSPCRVSLRVTTRSGSLIARGRTPTLGAGEIAQLHFGMTPEGHRLLARSSGNQLGARVTLDDGPASSSGAAAVAGDASATALVSLISYR